MKPRTILITGGSGKIGKALVKHFLASGDRVVATCRTLTSLDAMKKTNSKYDDCFVGIRCDLTNKDASLLLVEKLRARGIYPDSLVNNARCLDFLKLDKSGMVSRENFEAEYLLDVIVPFELTMALVSPSGSQLRRVINIGSQYGTVAANPNLYAVEEEQAPIHYGVAKAALAHLTKELAVRLAQDDIQVNCIAFGGVEGRVDDLFKKRYAKLCPMGRMLEEKDIVGPVDMLLSSHFSGMTGHVLAVDGGWTLW